MKRLQAIAAIAVSCITFMNISPVWAADYSAVQGAGIDLQKCLIVKGEAEIPAASFFYEVTSGAAVPETTTTAKVSPGPSPEKVKINNGTGSVQFLAGEPKKNGSPADKYTDNEFEAYSVHDIALDFSDIEYNEPGVYRYLITESEPTGTFKSLDDRTSTVDLYIEDQDGTLGVQGYTVYEGEIVIAPKLVEGEVVYAPLNESNGAEAGMKDSVFKSECETYNIEYGLEVTGNQGSRDKYFKFSIDLSGMSPGAIVNAVTSESVQNPIMNKATIYSEEEMKKANTRDDVPGEPGSQLKADSEGNISWTMYLHDGENVAILGIPKDVLYTVDEDEEDYQKNVGIEAELTSLHRAYNSPTTNIPKSVEETADASEAIFKVNGGAFLHAKVMAPAKLPFTLRSGLPDNVIVSDMTVTGFRSPSEYVFGHADVLTGFTNTRSGAIPTGVIIASGAGIAAIVIGCSGAGLTGRKKKRTE